MKPLFNQLNPADTNIVIATLESNGIEYEINGGGTMVAASRLLRPGSSGVGLRWGGGRGYRCAVAPVLSLRLRVVVALVLWGL